MEYLVKIDFSELNTKNKYEFIERVNGDKFKKYIVKMNDTVMIVKLQVFDYLIFDIQQVKKFSKNLRLSLLSRDEKLNTNKVEEIYKNVKINTDEYNEMIRTIRF